MTTYHRSSHFFLFCCFIDSFLDHETHSFFVTIPVRCATASLKVGKHQFGCPTALWEARLFEHCAFGENCLVVFFSGGHMCCKFCRGRKYSPFFLHGTEKLFDRAYRKINMSPQRAKHKIVHNIYCIVAHAHINFNLNLISNQ